MQNELFVELWSSVTDRSEANILQAALLTIYGQIIIK